MERSSRRYIAAAAMPPSPAPFTESSAREVLLLRAFEQEGASPLWTAEDQRWATQLARQGAGDASTPTGFLSERARHAMQRLLPREPAARRLVNIVPWRWAWCAFALVMGLALGAIVDHIGSAQHINLLAPPVWALLLWNLAMALAFVGLALWRLLRRAGRSAGGRPLPTWLVQRVLQRGAPAGPLQRFATSSALATGPLFAARAALLLHLAAAALALGLIGGMYVRGLVLDYRAAWQSTFVEAPAVQAWLDTALAPARRVSGVAVPEVAPLRVAPGGQAMGPAAPWLHLYATTLLLFVVLPRAGLAAVSAWRAWRGTSRVLLPLHEPYFQQLLAQRESRSMRIAVHPLGAAPAPAVVLALREQLAREWGDDVQLSWLPAAWADAPGAVPAAIGAAALQVALIDMATTPEAEVHGRWLEQQGAGGPPLRLVVDATAFTQRFALMPERLKQRRAAWQGFADAMHLECRFVDAAAALPR